MKKTCVILLSVILIFAGGVGVLAAGMGDVTGNDDRVTAADAREILRAAVGLEKLSAAKAARADMDLDGGVTAADARLALRTAVGLEKTDGNVYATQLEVLKSGHYYAEMTQRDNKGDVPTRIAVTKNTLFFDVTLDGVPLTILSNDTGLSFLDTKGKSYAVFSDELIELLSAEEEGDFDPMEMFTQVPIFSGLPDPQTAVYYEGTFDGEPCECYMEQTGQQTTTLYMDGTRLLAAVTEDRFGDVVSEMIFRKIMPVVSTECMAIPDGYEEKDFLEFIVDNYPELLEEAFRDS